MNFDRHGEPGARPDEEMSREKRLRSDIREYFIGSEKAKNENKAYSYQKKGSEFRDGELVRLSLINPELANAMQNSDYEKIEDIYVAWKLVQE